MDCQLSFECLNSDLQSTKMKVSVHKKKQKKKKLNNNSNLFDDSSLFSWFWFPSSFLKLDTTNKQQNHLPSSLTILFQHTNPV